MRVSFVVFVRISNSLNIRPVVISNYCCRVYLQQLYLCYYLERLLIIGLILSCRCYCFYYRSNWFNRLLLLWDLFLVLLLLFVYVIGSMFQFQILRFVRLLPTYLDDFRSQFPIRSSDSDISCYSHVVRVQLSDFRFQFFNSFGTIVRFDRRDYSICSSSSRCQSDLELSNSIRRDSSIRSSSSRCQSELRWVNS